MERIEVDIDEEKMVSCLTCDTELFSLPNITAYCRREGRFVLVGRSNLAERVRLSQPYLSNEPCFFLMHLQRVQCGLCGQALGLYFRTANVDNEGLLQQFLIDVAALKRGKIEEKAFGMMEQALDKRLQEEDPTLSIEALHREDEQNGETQSLRSSMREGENQKGVSVEELLFGIMGAYGYLREVKDKIHNKLDEFQRRIQVVRRRLNQRARKRRDSTPDLT